jgi:cell division GTPase FtsZ
MNENPNNENKSEEQVQAFYNEPSVDISLPEDMVIPPANDPVQHRREVLDETEGAFKFCFIGAGQGGSRIAEAFHRIGYRRIVAINTAQQDLNAIKLENKLCIGDGGAGKDPSVADKAFKEKKEDVLDFLRYSFGEVFDRVIVCAGAGGGSGAGTVIPVVETIKELHNVSEGPNRKVGMILALPKASEGKRVAQNALATLIDAYKLVRSGIVSPLILLDNERFSNLYPNLSVSKFWGVSNANIAGLFHLFNMTASKDSSYSSFDKNDYGGVLDSGLTVFGTSPVRNWEDPISISRTLRENLLNNVLTSGVNLSSGDVAAAIVIGSPNQLDNISQSSLDQAFDQLNRMLKKGSTVHRGIYSGDKDQLNVFTAIGGLNKPEEKIQELKEWGGVDPDYMPPTRVRGV